MRSKCGLTPSAAHINGVKPNQSGSISWVPLALKRKRQCCRRKTDTPLCWNVWVFIFSPARLCIRARLSIPWFWFKRCWLNRAWSWSRVRSVGVKQMDVSSYQNISPSTISPVCSEIHHWSRSVLVSVCGSWQLSCCGGASMNALGRLPALWVSTEQSELHTERGGGGMTPAQSCWLGFEVRLGRGHETGSEQTGHLLTGSSAGDVTHSVWGLRFTRWSHGRCLPATWDGDTLYCFQVVPAGCRAQQNDGGLW